MKGCSSVMVFWCLGVLVSSFLPKTQSGRKPETRNPKPETRNPKPETRNPKPETRNPKPETRNPKLKNSTFRNLLVGNGPVRVAERQGQVFILLDAFPAFPEAGGQLRGFAIE